MVRIHRVYSAVLPADRQRVEQVQEIFRDNFSAIADYALKIPDLLNRPFAFGFQSVLLVSENGQGRVTAFSLFLCFPEIESALLDFIAVRKKVRGSGLGSVLYEATREYLRELGSRGLYMEVLPDDSSLIHDKDILAENRKRLRFYENYGVRPIMGTDFETPVDADPAPYLLFDSLGRPAPLGRAEARAAVRLILKRKYAHVVGQDYIERVVESFVDDPVRTRPPRYVKAPVVQPAMSTAAVHVVRPFVFVSSPVHSLHHVRDRGYVERPARVDTLRDAISVLPMFEEVGLSSFPEKHIRAVHAADFVAYLRNVCLKLNTKRPVYPYVFPIRRPDRRPKDLSVRAGYYCIDTFTPLDRNAYDAARAAVNTALTGAQEVLRGRRVAYAICRPPGHHAEHRVFGGFCYFNNAAIAANFMSLTGRVAVLDIDYHHGNGTQNIFYERDDVLTVSIHGHPNIAYPYFSGFADEQGEGKGTGCCRNYPLPEPAGKELYMAALTRALAVIRHFAPMFLVVSLGFDTIKGDPTGTFTLRAGDMLEIGEHIGELGLPTLVVQEGGYNLRNLKAGAPAFFNGLHKAVGGISMTTKLKKNGQKNGQKAP